MGQNKTKTRNRDRRFGVERGSPRLPPDDDVGGIGNAEAAVWRTLQIGNWGVGGVESVGEGEERKGGRGLS